MQKEKSKLDKHTHHNFKTYIAHTHFEIQIVAKNNNNNTIM